MTTLLVASTGGHLAQLHELRPRLRGIDPDVAWVTFDTPQSRALLAGERVTFVRHTATRDYRSVVGNTRSAARLLRGGVTGVVSTGAGVALSFLPLAAARGLPCHYIESATRAVGPSATGRLLQRIPAIALYAQHRRWADGRWHHAGSVFDGYTLRGIGRPQLSRVVVTLGAHEMFGFRALVERLVEVMPEGVDVLWQTGATDVSGLPIDAWPFVDGGELKQAIAEADVVVAHAGIGSALGAFQAGRRPILVPRDPARGEHVDDHQLQVAEALDEQGLAIIRQVEDLVLTDLLLAASTRVVRNDQPPPFQLRG
ncbi:MAG: glycosyltransferase [Solirubrobacteraceae bacterium]